eukprot:COSAG04_NODE_175_length_21521_cov_167.404071_6_plen_77_part_00
MIPLKVWVLSDLVGGGAAAVLGGQRRLRVANSLKSTAAKLSAGLKIKEKKDVKHFVISPFRRQANEKGHKQNMHAI